MWSVPRRAQARFARGDDVVVRERAGTPLAEARSWWRRARRRADRADRGAEDLLRLPERVHVGGVDQVHARVERTVDHRAGVALVDGGDRRHAGAERHRAERQHRHLEPARARGAAVPRAQSAGLDRGGFQRAERAEHQAEPHRRAVGDGAGAVGDRGAVEREAQPAVAPRPRRGRGGRRTRRPGRYGFIALRHGTILEIGSSMMPVAPGPCSAGIRVLISLLATTVSTA